jgi:hypothetical protein
MCVLTGELDASRDNLKVAKEILALRVQQATMHGYANYAEYATADTMAGKPAKVMELLEVSGAEGGGCVRVYCVARIVVGFGNVDSVRAG